MLLLAPYSPDLYFINTFVVLRACKIKKLFYTMQILLKNNLKEKILKSLARWAGVIYVTSFIIEITAAI